MRTYFTFADDAIGYDCAACGQRCCRGKGFALSDGELLPLLTRAPALGPHLKLRPGATIGAVDLTERCWFLDGNGHCDLEVRHGREAKPSTCRLFPVNRIYRLGEVRIVDLNTLLCPVEPAPGRGLRHQALAVEIEAFAGSPLVDVPPPLPTRLDDDWLEREEAAARAAREVGDDPTAFAVAQGESRAEALHSAWRSLYGLDEATARTLETAVAPRVSLLAPTLRFGHLFAPGVDYPHASALLPRRLRALTLLGALAARALGAPPSLRGLTELWREQAMLLDVLVRFDRPVHLTNPSFDADVPALLQPALGQLLGGAFRGGSTLGELVLAAASTLPGPARPLALALAARQLAALAPEPAPTAR